MIARHMRGLLCGGLVLAGLFVAVAALSAQTAPAPAPAEGEAEQVDSLKALLEEARGPIHMGGSLQMAPELPPAASKELLQRYVDAVKQSPRFKFFKELEVQAVRKAAQDWEKELKVKLEIQSNGVLKEVTDGLSDAVLGTFPVGQSVWARLERSESRGYDFLMLRFQTEGDIEYQFRVAPSELAELSFEYAYSVTIGDAALTPLERFVATQENLGAVVQRLCKAGNMDFSLPIGRMAELITLDVRNKTPAECLSLAARAAGWWVRYTNTFVSNGVSSSVRDSLPVPRVTALDLWRDVAAEPLEGGSATPSALELLKQRVAEAVKLISAQRPVVIMGS